MAKTIFLHGLGQTDDVWSPTIQIMKNKTDCLRPNLSDWLTDKTPCYQTLYETLENYCTLFDEPLNLCGLSLGGILALQYGIEHPDKVRSLVLIGTQYTMPKRLLKFQNLIFRLMPASKFQKTGFEKAAFISLCKSMMDLEFTDDLSKISCRTLVVCGEHDKANKPASLQLRQRIPNAKLRIIPHAAHEVNVDNPAALGHTLNCFFNSI